MNAEAVAEANQQEHTRQHCLQDDALDVKAVDWNRVWQARLARCSSPKRDARFWEGRAVSFAKSIRERAYADQFLAIMKPEAHFSVLDMGCGSGALAIPLAKQVSSVTAVDFADAMLEVVRKQCVDENIRNIKTILGSWEDDWTKLGIEPCDVAIASRSLMMDDLGTYIQKLNNMARKRVYLVTVVGNGPHDRRIFDALSRPFVPGPDYIYYYNLLYQMDIHANVAFIEETRNRTFADPQEAAASMHWMFEKLNAREEALLAAFLHKHLVFRDNTWRLSYDTVVRWAVMWWEKK